jgi:hypothetical protein
MTVSDKYAVYRRRYPKPRQGAGAISNNDLTNKSVPRTRKEKCQTAPRNGQIGLLPIEGHGIVIAFRCTFALKRIPVILKHSPRG